MMLLAGGAIVVIIMLGLAYWYFYYYSAGTQDYTGPRSNTWSNVGEATPETSTDNSQDTASTASTPQ